ncbi:MAG TPA: DUF5074 domain-containing protein [Chitinophagales bacterium]|nr:DUF5074 domain-containing protein [Chitinophagales bacterium]
MNFRVLYIIPLLAFAIAGCHKEEQHTDAPATNGVYITSEGNFNFGNAEVSFYNPAVQTVSNNLFSGVNGYALGDVAQSMYIKDSLGFIVVNNSQKVEVVKIPSLQHVRTIVIANASPRYFLPVNDSIAYVTELYAGKIHVINYQTGVLVKDITGVSAWTEHMLFAGGIVVVEERSLSSNASHQASIITLNPVTNSFVQRYSFAGSNLNGIVKDNQGRLWLAIEVDSAHAVPASLCCLKNDFSVNKKIDFATGHHPSNLCINGNGTMLYFFDDGISRLSVNDSVAPSAFFVAQNNRNFYGLGIDPVSGDVYVSDALDYVQKSQIYRYHPDGDLVQSFAAGIISGNFAFNEQ